MKAFVNKIRDQLSPALVISLAALFVALSGSAYAVSQLPKNSVGSPQIKNGSVRTVDLGRDVKRKLNKAGVRGPRGFAGESGATGPRGLNGATGATGSTGAAGAPGLINWGGVYEVTANRTGSGYVEVTCTGDDQIVFADWYASGTAQPSTAGRGNGGRSYGYTMNAPSGATSITVVGYCSPS